jgi:hypothetical protein
VRDKHKEVVMGKDVTEGKANDTLRDVYIKCLEDTEYFPAMTAAVAPVRNAATAASRKSRIPAAKKALRKVLKSRKHTLHGKCFNSLFECLGMKWFVTVVTTCLERGLSWDEMVKYEPPHGEPGGPCHWPDCPSEPD